MQRALELAHLGLGSVSPNPLVGCVIVHEGKIIGEGYHMEYGGAHAEVNAINSVKDRKLLSDSDVYVSLEPCAHFGKTPPCANLLAESNVRHVFIANCDPNPLVAGKGIKILKKAGIHVESGVLHQEGEELNKRYFTYINERRPYIILKWAQTADGFIARKDFNSKWISNKVSRKLVHKWRAEEDAILVGKRTAEYDNPRLNVRDWRGKNPIRIVIDPRLSLDRSLSLFDGSIETICYNIAKTQHAQNVEFVQLEKRYFLEQLLNDLYLRNIQSLMVEGGSTTLNSFISAGTWDEARVFHSRTTFGDGIPAPKLTEATLAAEVTIQDDRLMCFRKSKTA